MPGLLAARTYGHHFIEHLQKALADGSLPQAQWCLAAVGGFGRGELSFASDLDLLFLYQNRLPHDLQDAIRELTYCLWDSGFEVGHVTASLSAVKKLVGEDFTALTNHLEARFVGGDTDLYNRWRDSFLHSFGAQSCRRFLNNLIAYREERLHQYGESSYLLEPHVKEGVGGLRDLQLVRWAGMVFLRDTSSDALVQREWMTPQEKLWVEQAYDFLWRVRLQLHQLTGRRQDQLLFPEQEQIASRLGFMDGREGAAVEAFMRVYYRHTARIRRTTSFFLERLEESQRKGSRFFGARRRILPGPFLLEGQHLHFMEPEWIKEKPGLLMQFFWQAVHSDAHFHHQAGQVIRENLGAFDENSRRDPEVVRQFFEILLHPRRAFTALKTMLETGFLDVFIPEFSGVRYRVQHDVYHLYTVDEHLLRTVRELHRMEEGKEEDTSLPAGASDIFVQLSHKRVLFLAALLHDIGKGMGKDHSIRGAEIVEAISARMGFSPEERNLLTFLVRKHLILAETALKRDLMDEKPVMHCAMETDEIERLRMLYLLTIADSKATGPGAWNTWKASLLRELYVKVERLLLRGDWEREDLQKRSEEVQRRAILVASGMGELEEEIGRWLETASFRYLLSQTPEDIVQHFRMEKELREKPLAFHARQLEESKLWRVTVVTRDRPGLFALITGVLWARGLNILSADLFTQESGEALDIILVERLPDPLRSQELWERVRQDLEDILVDRTRLDGLIRDKRRPSFLQAKGLPRKEDRVLIDEEASDFYTIIEVYTWDRPGVLHAITDTLFKLDLSIQLAKISTPGAQVADVFYVTDLSGNKLMDPELHDKIRHKLLECLSVTV